MPWEVLYTMNLDSIHTSPAKKTSHNNTLVPIKDTKFLSSCHRIKLLLMLLIWVCDFYQKRWVFAWIIILYRLQLSFRKVSDGVLWVNLPMLSWCWNGENCEKVKLSMTFWVRVPSFFVSDLFFFFFKESGGRVEVGALICIQWGLASNVDHRMNARIQLIYYMNI